MRAPTGGSFSSRPLPSSLPAGSRGDEGEGLGQTAGAPFSQFLPVLDAGMSGEWRGWWGQDPGLMEPRRPGGFQWLVVMSPARPLCYPCLPSFLSPSLQFTQSLLETVLLFYISF